MSISVRILVVDDEPILCELTARILTRQGHIVITAFDGQAVISLLQKDRDFGLVITDLFMP
ncbi:MAG: response regulator, partial [Anaerolineae bacterium]|nr:response regulator [Anaerolineae bacterium]